MGVLTLLLFLLLLVGLFLCVFFCFKFTFGDIDVIGLRIFMNQKLGWEETTVNQHLLPVMKQLR